MKLITSLSGLLKAITHTIRVMFSLLFFNPLIKDFVFGVPATVPYHDYSYLVDENLIYNLIVTGN